MINIANNVPLAQFTTMKVGGPAQFFARVKDEADLRAAMTWAKEKNVPIFTIGGGSNLIFTDEGFHGLVIKAD